MISLNSCLFIMHDNNCLADSALTDSLPDSHPVCNTAVLHRCGTQMLTLILNCVMHSSRKLSCSVWGNGITLQVQHAAINE